MKFEMHEAKLVVTPLAQHFKLSKYQAPQMEDERRHMGSIQYASCAGCLMYAMVCTRPDLAYAMSIIRRFITDPGLKHLDSVKWVMRYVKRSLNLGLVYKANRRRRCEVEGFVDSAYADYIYTRRSLIGYIFTALGGCISWKSNLQRVVVLSSTEAEFMVATEAIKEAIWLKGLIKELVFRSDDITGHCNNQSALHLMKNPMFHDRSKHIDIKLYFIRDIIAKKEIQVKKDLY
ncbi:hypothetical protein CsatB_008016 [Cannabis sativa]|uniref:Retrovirus-related Pol polyprotein from transposon TNT 1-94 n=1 Tax=Cannabis sativa TaxID=3483 RepID=A0A803NJZ7_CANSA|nr:secreted RxLR effector protein 161-like [Cannabis sativa]